MLENPIENPVKVILPEDPMEDVPEDDLFEITDSVKLNAYLEKSPTGEYSGVVLRIRVPNSEKVIDKGVGLSKIIGQDIVDYFINLSKSDATDEGSNVPEI